MPLRLLLSFAYGREYTLRINTTVHCNAFITQSKEDVKINKCIGITLVITTYRYHSVDEDYFSDLMWESVGAGVNSEGFESGRGDCRKYRR